MTIDIPKNGPVRLNSSQRIRYSCGSYIACMPYLITIFKMVNHAFINVSVCIAQQANPYHFAKVMRGKVIVFVDYYNFTPKFLA
jgi:hypothetical protein